MNKSDVLRALEWVDQAAQEGDRESMIKARLALENELTSKSNTKTENEAYSQARESFVRKHGRDPLGVANDDPEVPDLNIEI